MRTTTSWVASSLIATGCTLFVALAPAQAACTFLDEPQSFNTDRQDDVVVIGLPPGRSYQVLVTAVSADALWDIRTCVVDAFVTRSRFGNFIQVGSFERRGEAEAVRRSLRRAGYRARVTYRDGRE